MMNYLELAGTLAGVVYLWLEYKASAWLWVASIVMPTIYLKVYYDAGLYADFGISVYYIVASLYGLICWVRQRKVSAGGDFLRKSPNGQSDRIEATDVSDDSPGIRHTPRRLWIYIAVVFVLLWVAMGFLLVRLTDSVVPWADAFTTALSIVALWMLAKKYIEQWLVWIAADAACAILYAYKDLWMKGALYLAYAIVAVFGYVKWKKMMK